MRLATIKHSTKLKKGDLVEIVCGKDRSSNKSPKRGRLLRIDYNRGRVFVEGLNIVKKTKRRTQEDQAGSIVQVEASLDISNVMIICKKCGRTRIAIKKAEDGKRERVCRKCGEVL